MSLSSGLMSNIKNNILTLKEELKDSLAKVIAISKTYTVAQVKELYDNGINDFGENRVEELLNKKGELKDYNITWHFVGNLQSNKVKKVINEIDYLHSLDRLSVAKEINKYRKTPLKCFIQINIAEEESKSGLKLADLSSFLINLKKYDKIIVVGFMAMGVLNDLEKTEFVFKELAKLANKTSYKELSMGMSDDYLLAVKYGATFLRLGRMLVR